MGQENFDDHEEEHQTTIILDRVCDHSLNISDALRKYVDAIEPALILFLRRIGKLHLTLFKSSLDDKPAISKRFHRVKWTPDSGIVSIRDQDSGTTRRWYKHRYQTDFEGTETQRQGITETDIVLAFPVMRESGTYIPRIRRPNFAYAYLPLGDFGFKVRDNSGSQGSY